MRISYIRKEIKREQQKQNQYGRGAEGITNIKRDQKVQCGSGREKGNGEVLPTAAQSWVGAGGPGALLASQGPTSSSETPNDSLDFASAPVCPTEATLLLSDHGLRVSHITTHANPRSAFEI